MKNQTLAILATVLVIVLGYQAFMLNRLNDRVNALSQPATQAQNRAPLVAPGLQPPPLSKALPDDDFFNGQQWNPYEEIQRMQNEIEKMFGNSFSRFHLNSPTGSLVGLPDVDLQDKPDHYLVTVNAPGADESSISVKLEDRLLSISIKTEQARQEEDKQNSDYRYRERFVGEFHRRLSLPGPANADKMKTEYKNGVLTITIPKS